MDIFKPAACKGTLETTAKLIIYLTIKLNLRVQRVENIFESGYTLHLCAMLVPNIVRRFKNSIHVLHEMWMEVKIPPL